MKDYIKSSSSRALKNRNEFSLLKGRVPVVVINKLPNDIDFNNIIKNLEKNIPSQILNLIDGIYIGDFKELEERNIEAMFKDGAIYLSSYKNIDYASEELIARNICHELAHALEEKMGYEIYGDKLIQNEFKAKKDKLISLLNHEGFYFSRNIFFDPELTDELDDLLYNEIGYDRLSLIIPNLFISPYSVTSIREYFANGVEEYLFGDPNLLKSVNPVLYSKINKIYNEIS
jgi:Mlc titration factor MtfA (ptsG expression regulator)